MMKTAMQAVQCTTWPLGQEKEEHKEEEQQHCSLPCHQQLVRRFAQAQPQVPQSNHGARTPGRCGEGWRGLLKAELSTSRTSKGSSQGRPAAVTGASPGTQQTCNYRSCLSAPLLRLISTGKVCSRNNQVPTSSEHSSLRLLCQTGNESSQQSPSNRTSSSLLRRNTPGTQDRRLSVAATHLLQKGPDNSLWCSPSQSPISILVISDNTNDSKGSLGQSPNCRSRF